MRHSAGRSTVVLVWSVVASMVGVSAAHAQRVRLPQTYSAFQGGGVTTQPALPSTPGGVLAPAPQPAYGGPAGTIGAPTFDPYSSSGAASSAPSLLGSPATSPYTGGVPGYPPSPSYGTVPGYGTSGGVPSYGAPVYGAPGYGAPGYGAAGTPYGYGATGAYPSAPPAQFPNGLQLWGPNAAAGAPAWGPPLRLFYGPRVRHTWLYDGDGANDFQWHDSDISFAIALPNFMYSGQPLYVLPSFSLNQWDGPQFHPPTILPPNPGSDLPSKSYDAFVDVGWQSDPSRYVGVDLGFRIGVWTDFETITTDSIRIQGKGLLKYQLTPAVQLKGGVIYVDRLKVKLIPAGGILWTPGPQFRFDIYFPEPKLSMYATTLGNSEVWMYVAGEYGGGSWTVKRTAGFTDEIDLNDIRLIAGVEWARPDMIRQGRRIGFIEAGWVFDRELLYRSSPASNLEFDDTFVLRAGIGY